MFSPWHVCLPGGLPTLLFGTMDRVTYGIFWPCHHKPMSSAKETVARWIPNAKFQSYGVSLAAVVGFDGVGQGSLVSGSRTLEMLVSSLCLISKGSHKNQPLSLSWGERCYCHVKGFKTQTAGGGVRVGVRG